MNLLGWFGSLRRSIGAGSRSLRFGFAAVELSHYVGANRPRRDLRAFRLLCFAVGDFEGRADEAAFDEDVRALLDRSQDVLGETRTEDADAVPLGFRGPLVVGVFPRALRGDGQHGELGTVVPRLTLLRVGSNKSDEGY